MRWKIWIRYRKHILFPILIFLLAMALLSLAFHRSLCWLWVAILLMGIYFFIKKY